jgi:pyruvate dehydrogenase E2 component (dihydrolipoamide acetyltransferase)
MPIQILMPALSPTMTEGNLTKWLKKEGETVRAGDFVAEIETDKATMEVEAADDGVLGKILVPAGSEGVKVNTPIALLLAEGEDRSALSIAPTPAKPAPAPPAPAKVVSTPVPVPVPVPVVAPSAVAATGARLAVSPLARRLAQQAGVDLRNLRGSGPGGRIVKADVEGLSGAPAAAARAVPTAAAAFGLPPYVERPNSNIRKIVARRLTEAKRDAPHFYLSIDCDIGSLNEVRRQMNEIEGMKVSVNDFIIRAAALALKQVPAANASWTESAIRVYQSADISVAVAIPDGLITPILRAAESKSIPAISSEMKGLAERARAGKLRPEEFQGGTFSISNLGMYGIREFAAVINPPQGAILAVGAGEQRAVVRNGQLAVAAMMTCTLSVDHRVVDGAVGAEFLVAFKKLIEQPVRLLL